MTVGGTLARALIRWQRAAGPYWLYVCPAPFLGDVASRATKLPRSVRPIWLDALLTIIQADERVAVFVDEPIRLSLASTPLLNASGLIVVPVIQRWCMTPSVLPSRRLVDLLVASSVVAAPVNDPLGIVFLLDGERNGAPPSRGSRQRRLVHRAFDNRYTYSLDRFPSAAALMQRGITAVRWVTGSFLADDLTRYAQELRSGGLAPLMLTEPAFDGT